MLRKGLLALTFASGLTLGTAFAQVIVQQAPPAPIVETRPATPGSGYVWISGYHNWNGSAYVWVPGRWERPPHAGQHWVAHHWVHRHNGYVLVEGRWR